MINWDFNINQKFINSVKTIKDKVLGNSSINQESDYKRNQKTCINIIVETLK